MPRKKPKSELTEYEKIRAIWYKKLEADGFEDIEQDEHHLKVWSSSFVRKRPLELMESRTAYYHMARNFLNDYTFASEREKFIWKEHSEGTSVKSITEALRRKKVKTNRTYVWQIINKLETTMKFMYIPDYKNE